MIRGDDGLFQALLRHHRKQRGSSQLDLALAADISARHLSFLETGRARPSREMVLRLGATLGLTLRERNRLLEAAAFSPEFAEPSFDEALPPTIENAIERMMAQQEPFPLTVLTRRYDVVRANAAAMRVIRRFTLRPEALGTPLNPFRLLFDPRLARPFVLDWERVAQGFLARLHRESLARRDDEALSDLIRTLVEYPGVPERFRRPDLSQTVDPTLTFRLRRDDLELGFLTTMTVFNAPQNITLEEMTIESYFPLDEATAEACRLLAS
jgi:transcriptional regulator with XRE-family HTH domain